MMPPGKDPFSPATPSDVRPRKMRYAHGENRQGTTHGYSRGEVGRRVRVHRSQVLEISCPEFQIAARSLRQALFRLYALGCRWYGLSFCWYFDPLLASYD
jgi:hypothetical protein